MSNRNYSARSMAEVGITLAIIIVIMFVTTYIPFLNYMGVLILPIPITLLYLRHGIKITLTAVVASSFLVGMFFGPIIAISTSITYSITGISLGFCIDRDKQVYSTIAIVAMASVLGTIINISLFIFFIEKSNFISFINEYLLILKEQFRYVKDLYINMGIPKENLQVLDLVEQSINTELLLTVIPGSLALVAIISSVINYIITGAVLKRFEIKTRKMISFSKVYMPNPLGALIIGAIALGIILDSRNIGIGEYLKYFSLGIGQILFTINGLAALTYYFRVKIKTPKSTVFLILLISLILGGNTLYIYIGFMDMFFDFRRLDPYRITKKKSGV